MPNISAPQWEASYPEGWTSEESEDSIAFFDAESEVGTLQVSVFCKEDPVTEADLLEFAEELVAAGKRYGKVSIGELSGLMFRYYAGEESWREWYLSKDNCLFFITYDCPREAEGVEDEEVAQLLESIRLLD